MDVRTRIKAAIAVVAAYGLWKYYRWARETNDVRSDQDAEVPRAPTLPTSRLNEFAKYDRWTHGNAVASIREFSRLYQESFLADSNAMSIACRMHAQRAKTIRELYGLKMWVPNDAGQHRRILAAIEEIDALMAESLRELSDRRDVRGVEPRAGRLRPQDSLGVRPADDTWDF